jgi:Fe-S cluster assembly ATPase SufC/energy-coupling factor transporter ATP-binding protein EcfA2
MLHAIRLSNFKSIREARLPLAKLTMLIGANASGKSNVLEAIQVLSWVADGGRLEGIEAALKERQLGVRGSVARLSGQWDLEPSFGLGCEVEADLIGELVLDMRLQHTKKGLHIVAERLTSPDYKQQATDFYEVKEPAPDSTNQMTVSYNNFKRGGNKPTVVCSDQQAVFNQLVSPARFGEAHTESQETIPAACIHVQAALASILFLDPNPSAMRGYSYQTDTRMQGNGANVSAVLYEVCVEQQKKAQVLDFVRRLPEQDIKDLRFVQTPRGEVLVEVVETFGGKERAWDAGLLSDGTLRVLAIAAALHSVDRGSLVVIEEIDNGVHPSRADMLLSHILALAEERDLRILVTTHNPALLDALPPKTLGDVVVCFRGEEGDTKLVRLSDLERFPSLVAQGPLGDLVTSRVVDRFVKAKPQTPEATAQKLDEWMASLESRLPPGYSG